MGEWQGIVAIVAGLLIALFTHRWWLRSLLDILYGKHIELVWAGKRYSLTISQAESVMNSQHSALTDEKWGVAARLKSIPGVRKVELLPKVVGGKLTGELAFRVTVDRKKPLNQLRAEDVIPTQIGNVKTDVVEEQA